MGLREFTRSGSFVAVVFALVVVLLPFGLEQIGEATTLFTFPVTKTVKGWFSPARPAAPAAAARTVDWERYRHDLEDFSRWVEHRSVAVILPPPEAEVIRVEEEAPETVRRMWPVPVTACTPGDPLGFRKGYVFIAGFDQSFGEGAVIEPSEDLCGYEILFIGERTVYFRAVFDDADATPIGSVRFPEFSRVDGESLVRGKRRYVTRDAFPLKSGGWLMVDSFLPPDAVVFKILDETRSVVATILCVVIGEKGGR